MATGVVYNLATGMIITKVTAPDEQGISIQIHGKEDTLGVLFEDLDMVTQYILDGQPTTRPVMPLVCVHDLSEPVLLATGETITIKGIPKDATVYHPDGATEIDDGYIEWGSNTEGEYHLHLVCAPYQEVTIHAIVG